MPSNSLLWMIFGNHWLLITDITTTWCPNKLLTDFWGQCWDTKFLDYFDKAFGPSSYSNLDLVILGHFVSNFFQDWSESDEMLSKIFTYQLLPIDGVDLLSEDKWPSENLEAGLTNHYWSSSLYHWMWQSISKQNEVHQINWMMLI